MTIEDFGARVASVWQGLRPATRSLVERALSAQPHAAAAHVATPRPDAAYDARSEWELSRLLAALDERAAEKGSDTLSDEQSSALLRMAETCATFLHRGARSAEVFAQLLERALRSKDYTRVDVLADVMASRLAVQDGGAGVGHARQLARLLGAQQGLALRARALVERGEQAAQLPLGACVVGGVAARCRDARHRRRRGQRALDEPSRRGPQALPHARHARSEFLNRHP